MDSVMPLPDLSIVIPASRKREAFDCLFSLSKQNVDKNRFEVIPVCKDAKIFNQENWHLNLITVEADILQAATRRNRGVETSKGKFLAFLDDDTIVPPDWVSNVINNLQNHNKSIIGGPNFDKRSETRFSLANALQANIFAEGLVSHRPIQKDYIECCFTNIPLCNLACTRELFMKIGGFNEKADHYVDDTEFCYIANKLGYNFLLFRNLEIQHNVRPVFESYFRRQAHARFHAGMNFLIFPECYIRAPQVKLVLLSFILGPLLLFTLNASQFIYLMTFYFLILLVTSLKYLYRPVLFLLFPLSIFLVHINGYLSFVSGMIYGIFSRSNFKEVIEYKKERYAVFQSQS